MKKPKVKRFGAVRKPSGRVRIEQLTPWHVDQLNNWLSMYAVEAYKKKKPTVAEKTLAWVANELLARLQDRTIKNLLLKPSHVGVLILALAPCNEIDMITLKGQLHRLL